VKRRAPKIPGHVRNGVPAPLGAGPCIEVWVGPSERPQQQSGTVWPTWRASQAHTRFTSTKRAWAAHVGLPAKELHSLVPSRAPFSVEFLVAEGRAEQAAEMLARAGALVDDVPSLHKAAMALMTQLGVVPNGRRTA
jgi:hypothetical protein